MTELNQHKLSQAEAEEIANEAQILALFVTLRVSAQQRVMEDLQKILEAHEVIERVHRN